MRQVLILGLSESSTVRLLNSVALLGFLFPTDSDWRRDHIVRGIILVVKCRVSLTLDTSG